MNLAIEWTESEWTQEIEDDMKTKHTPGPWFVDMDPIDTGTDIRALNGWNGSERIPNQMLAQMAEKRDDTRDANARLIAAAPELLEACIAVYEDPYTTCACADKVREAIAKATSDKA